MRNTLVSALVCVSLLWSITAHAQSAPDREQTIAMVISRVAQIQADSAAAYQPFVHGDAVPAEALKPVLEQAIKQAVDLRDELASNPFVRVASISIAFPAGVTIELSFADGDQ